MGKEAIEHNHEDAPLILTAKLDESSQLFFDKLRTTHFPKHINYLKAHCTLFHKLPSSEALMTETLIETARRPSITMNISGIHNIGNGVIYKIDSTELLSVHQSLQRSFAAWLINQDRQSYKPHITIQNKVTAFKAAALYNELSKEFEPFTIKAVGISAWLYLGGPWQHVRDFDFES